MVEDIIKSDDLKGLVLAWVNDSTNKPEVYLTQSGLAFINGYCQGRNTVKLIRVEKYNILLENYEELIKKYEILKIKHKKLINSKFSLKRFINKFFHI